MKEIRTSNKKMYRILNRLKTENDMFIDSMSLSKNDKRLLDKIGAKIENNKIFLNNNNFKLYYNGKSLK